MQGNILNMDCISHDSFLTANISHEFHFGRAYILKNNQENNALLKMIANIDVPKSGRLLMNGYDISINIDIYRKYTCYLSSDFEINHRISVKSYLKYISRINNLRLHNVAIRYFDLKDRENDKICDLDKLEKSKLLLASILCKDANILCLINPYNNLDAKYQKKLSDIISSRIENDGIVFLISDDINHLQNILLRESIKYEYFEL